MRAGTLRFFDWPGSTSGGTAVAEFEDRVAAPEQAFAFHGPWSLFRLLDMARRPSTASAHSPTFETQVATKYHQATIAITGTSDTLNPLSTQAWRQFSCAPLRP